MCQGRNICGQDFDSSNCTTGFYCQKAFGEACESCQNINQNKACRCGINFISNCAEYLDNKCIRCRQGLQLVNDICLSNTCTASSSSAQCAINSYCPLAPTGSKVICQQCYKDSPVSCSCGTAQNCATCNSSNNTCFLCIKGFKLVSGKCVRKQNICDIENLSTQCKSGHFCNGSFSDLCSSCDNISIDLYCNYNGNLLQQCKQCYNNIYSEYLQGYTPINRKCMLNVCDQSLSNEKCINGYICVSRSNPNDSCQQCIESQIVSCKCGTAIHCATCGRSSNTCKKCVPGLEIITQTQSCGEKQVGDNICDENLTSNSSYTNYFCNAKQREKCTPCSNLPEGKACKCLNKLLINCRYCSDSQCTICIFGICQPNTCGSKYLSGFYCPDGGSKQTACRTCSLDNHDPCVCRQATNCQSCTNLKNQCYTCIEKFVLINGLCLLPPNCDVLHMCPIGQLCSELKCRPCFDQQITCSCGDAVNCQNCGQQGACLHCINGWLQDMNGNCKIPICTMPMHRDQYCAAPESPQPCSSNPLVINTMQHKCNCGITEPGDAVVGCANCELIKDACKQCMKEHTLMGGICIFTPAGYKGSCDDTGSSRWCAEGLGCKNYGQCVDCIQLRLDMECKCQDDVRQVNCAVCDGKSCKICVDGAVLMDKQCRRSCDTNMECEQVEMCFNNLCIPCDGTLTCKCGISENCKRCSADNRCSSCMNGYIQDPNQSCADCAVGYSQLSIFPSICQIINPEDKTLSTLDIVGLVFAGLIIILTVCLIVYQYLAKPKKYYQQHNLKALQNNQ
ncbi:Cysteine-rich membrane protein 2 [Spironucleus salmonicida]|uniref:Cysteine-rich membrane protein 2 n=1 Tax=Spironucleus salmonicida TaxID=348837 RepID=V6LUC5_9EUKA|nr:Cysteine-rich membrane protein 2 [Spironucleus salmonicida]|eukprot:EST47863.1 Cysteine-rich membrane protein 2 [Spironucleus salmonicida]